MVVARPEYLYELQVAAQARLKARATLMAIITGVFDIAPEGQPTPYITYGQHVGGGMPTFGHVNSSAFFLLDIFSQAGADDECYQILGEVRAELQTTQVNPPLILPSHGQIYLMYEWSSILHETAYQIRHMPVRFRTKAVEL